MLFKGGEPTSLSGVLCCVVRVPTLSPLKSSDSEGVGEGRWTFSGARVDMAN
ncbi:hypothetical protein RSAG8_12220, partial [Rhizoctonia solani AG-8 WAC10335]